MAASLHLTIASPERVVVEQNIEQISLPTPLGEITVLPHHIPLIHSISPGEIRILKGGDESSLAISGGFAEVTSETVLILADTAERSEEIDEARALEARQRAEKLIKEKRVDSIEYTALAAKIEKELARLRVARKRRRTL